MKTAFICDSTLQIKKEFCRNYPLTVIPAEVRLGDNVYDDGVTITEEDFYLALNQGLKPATSQPSIGRVAEVLESLKDAGCERAVAFCVSKKLSGTYSSFTQAGELVSDLELKVIDTKQVARLAGKSVEKIIREFFTGKITYEIVEEEYKKLEEKQNILVTVENMDYLYAGGRLTKTQFVVSSFLNILPIITLEDGALKVCGKARSFKKVISKICDEIKEKNPKSILILHTNKEDLLEIVKKQVFDKFGDSIEIEIMPISAVIGTHAGDRAIGIAYYEYE